MRSSNCFRLAISHSDRRHPHPRPSIQIKCNEHPQNWSPVAYTRLLLIAQEGCIGGNRAQQEPVAGRNSARHKGKLMHTRRPHTTRSESIPLDHLNASGMNQERRPYRDINNDHDDYDDDHHQHHRGSAERSRLLDDDEDGHPAGPSPWRAAGKNQQRSSRKGGRERRRWFFSLFGGNSRNTALAGRTIAVGQGGK